MLFSNFDVNFHRKLKLKNNLLTFGLKRLKIRCLENSIDQLNIILCGRGREKYIHQNRNHIVIIIVSFTQVVRLIIVESQ